MSKISDETDKFLLN